LTGSDGTNQSGAATVTFQEHAGVWAGTAASFIDLHPGGGTLSSVANDTAGSFQTGSVTSTVTGPTHAARWSFTALSYLDIHPGAAYDNSVGVGTDGASIVGQVSKIGAGAFDHAGLWKFSPDSFTDLNPSGASSSIANDVDGSTQVGEAVFGSTPHGVLWSGTAASFVDMDPGSGSRLRGVDGGYQVGDAFVGPGASFKAGVWTGSAASFVNLHSFLTPFTYSSSEAWGVTVTPTNVYVIGSAFNDGTARNEAVLWTLAIPEPGSVSAIMLLGFAAMCSRRRSMRTR
jgi:hypothetical protein